jgi:hypothetical protein
MTTGRPRTRWQDQAREVIQKSLGKSEHTKSAYGKMEMYEKDRNKVDQPHRWKYQRITIISNNYYITVTLNVHIHCVPVFISVSYTHINMFPN